MGILGKRDKIIACFLNEFRDLGNDLINVNKVTPQFLIRPTFLFFNK